MSEEGGWRLLDDRGRVFGVVNVVDALVVVIVLAVVVAGVGLVLSSGEDTESESDADPEPAGDAATWYATLELEPQTASSAQHITPGDEWRVSETDDALLVTDVYRYETGNDTAVVARVAVDGKLLEADDTEAAPTFEFRGEPLTPGQSLDIVTGGTEQTATVTHLDQSGETLPLADSEFVLEADISAATGSELAVGDELTAGGDALGEIRTLERFPTEDGEHVLVGMTAQTLERGGSQFLGDTRLALGATLSFDADSYTLDGEVIHHGLEPPGTPTTQTVTLRLTDVSSDRADSLTAGLTEQTRDSTTAEVQDVTTTPTEVVVESADGDIHLREHPTRKDVELTVDLSVREQSDGQIRFRGEPLRTGQTLTLDLGTLRIDGELVELHA